MSTLRLIMAFDFGTKRMGVAIGQMVTHTATPLDTLSVKNGLPDWSALEKLFKKWSPDAFVVGIPLNMDGSDQPITAKARQFCEALREHYALPVFEMDERLSTKDAKERLFAKGGYKALQDGQVDRVAAQLILQSWFATQQNGKTS